MQSSQSFQTIGGGREGRDPTREGYARHETAYWSFAALLFAVAWLCIASPNAVAETYVVHACRADGAPAPLDGWSSKSWGSVDPAGWVRARRLFNDCVTGGGFGIDYQMATGDAPADAWTVTAPPDTDLAKLRLDDPEISPYSSGMPVACAGSIWQPDVVPTVRH